MTVTKDHVHDDTVSTRHSGRRSEDRHRNIEIHPIAVSVAGGVITLLLMVAGYFFKGWADNMMVEIRLLRQAAQKQLEESASNTEWKDGVNKWRDDTESRIRLLEHDHPVTRAKRVNSVTYQGGSK